MSKLRSVSTAFWSDPFIEELTPSQKLLFLYLITNEKTNMLGIYESSIKKISFETGIKRDDIEKALKEFERLKKVKYINNYVILINYMKHQNFNTNMKKSAIDVYNNLPNDLKVKDVSITKDKPSEGFETLLNCFAMVRKVEVEYEVETKEEVKLEIEVKREDEIKMHSKEVQDCFENCVSFFPPQLHPKDNNTWLDTIEKLNRIEKIPFNIIESIVKKTREDDFWSSNFLSLTKLRKKNRDGVMYAVVFNEKIKSNEKTGNTNNGRTANTVSEEYIKRLNDQLLS